jgi:hypothetical protein
MNRNVILCAALASTPWLATSVMADSPTQRIVAFADKDDDHKGEKKDLGKKEIAGFTVQVTQVGDVVAGKEALFILKLSGGAGKPKAIRGWVGIESGEKSIKSKAEDEEKEWHLHHEVSKPIQAKSKLWIELETAAGKKSGWFDYKQ